MRHLSHWLHTLISSTHDEEFLDLIEKIQIILSKLLSIAMIVVILVSVVDLGVILVTLLVDDPNRFFRTTLFQIFGVFLDVLIALEILENITAYLRRHVVQVELVIVTSLIAVARKIIILDLEKITGTELIGLAVAILALSLSYWIIRKNFPKRTE
jgi:uncharacterized membrane protein (DUF373 family)